jgi:hypothetical protein
MRSNTDIIAKQRPIMEFLKVIFWEYLQNLSIIAGFCWAFGFWQGIWIPRLSGEKL